ncbi:hypothetical protein K2X30_05505 [bacterium]|jgi:hypothetical protein|nr:hypothetical protein [bacterium]
MFSISKPLYSVLFIFFLILSQAAHSDTPEVSSDAPAGFKPFLIEKSNEHAMVERQGKVTITWGMTEGEKASGVHTAHLSTILGGSVYYAFLGPSYSAKKWDDAEATCTVKMGEGWRLPTSDEAYFASFFGLLQRAVHTVYEQDLEGHRLYPSWIEDTQGEFSASALSGRSILFVVADGKGSKPLGLDLDNNPKVPAWNQVAPREASAFVLVQKLSRGVAPFCVHGNLKGDGRSSPNDLPL